VDLQCNKLKNAAAGVYVYATAAGFLPGVWNCGGGTVGMGNKYSISCGGPIWYNVNNSITTPLQYRENSGFVAANGPNAVCSPNVEITDCGPITGSPVGPNPCNKVFKISGELLSEMGLQKQQIGMTERLLAEGDDENLMLMILKDSSEQIVNQYLQAQSPYLPDRMLLAAISQKPTPLSSASLLQILTHNSSLTPEVLSAAEQRTPALSQADLNVLHAAQTSLYSPRKIAENALLRDRHLWQNDLQELAVIWLDDSTGLGRDSLVEILTGETSEMALKMLIPELIQRRQYADASDLLSKLDAQVYSDYISIEKLRITLTREGRNFYQLTPVEKSLIDHISAGNTPEGWYCRGILSLIGNDSWLFCPRAHDSRQPGSTKG
jgi:hypothetical protein